MEGAEEARRQREQLERYLQWRAEEGGIEGPTHLSTWFKPHQQQRLRWLKQNRVGRTMELGCNYGYALAYCEGDIGVDWNERNIALAKILSPTKGFMVADIRLLPFSDGYVDTVMACDCLEHLAWEDIPVAIAEAKRVARQRVLITLPNGDLDTPEAQSMKHQWLATRGRIAEIRERFGPGWTCKVTRHRYFVFLRASRRQGQRP